MQKQAPAYVKSETEEEEMAMLAAMMGGGPYVQPEIKEPETVVPPTKVEVTIKPTTAKRSAPATAPTFESLISHQTFSGNWTVSVIPVLEKFFKDAPLTNSDYSADVWVTLLALYILAEVFDKKDGEWKMLAKKAKDYIR